MMRRFVILLFTAVIISATTMPAFAAKFTPSVEAKAAPEVVSQKGSDGNEYAAIIRDADGNEIKGVPFGDLIVTPVSKADDTSDSIKKRLETAYKTIKSAKSVTELNGQLEKAIKKVSPDTDIKNVVVRDLFDISTIGDYAKYLQEEGSTITIRFKLSADSALLLAVLTSVDGVKWSLLDGVITRDGYVVELVLDRLGLIAFLFDGGKLGVDTNGPKSPQTGDPGTGAGVWGTACGIFLLAAAACVVMRKRCSGKKQ